MSESVSPPVSNTLLELLLFAAPPAAWSSGPPVAPHRHVARLGFQPHFTQQRTAAGHVSCLQPLETTSVCLRCSFRALTHKDFGSVPATFTLASTRVASATTHSSTAHAPHKRLQKPKSSLPSATTTSITTKMVAAKLSPLSAVTVPLAASNNSAYEIRSGMSVQVRASFALSSLGSHSNPIGFATDVLTPLSLSL